MTKSKKKRLNIDYALEFRRAIAHIILGVFLVLFVLNTEVLFTIYCLIIAIVLGLVASAIMRKKRISLLYWFLLKFERKKNLRLLPGRGFIFFCIGSLIALFLFPQNIALASILILAIGDGFANIFGPIGRIKNIFHDRRKLEGSIIGLVGAIFAASLFVRPWIAILGALCAMMSEMVNLEEFHIDNNIIIPIVAGLIMMLLSGF
jgi:dolichol kinase